MMPRYASTSVRSCASEVVLAQRRGRGTQEPDQVGNQARRLRRTLLRELLRAAERVEQEVRLDLQLQQLQLRLGELPRELALPRLRLEARRERLYSRLRRLAIRATTNTYSTPNTSPAVTMWRNWCCPSSQASGSTPLASPATDAPTNAPTSASNGPTTM